MLGFLGEAGMPGLAVAAQDGDWQVRMAAAHALFPLGADAAPILRRIVYKDPCRVVRLIALHNLGSLEPSGREEAFITGILTDPPGTRNVCADQPGPGLLAKSPPPAASRPARTAESPPRPETPPAPAAPPSPSRAAAPPRGPAAAAASGPTKAERLAELDALLNDDKEAFPAAAAAAPKTPPPEGIESARAPDRPGAAAELNAPAGGAPETLPPGRPFPARDDGASAPPRFEASGSKGPHDAVPDLIDALKSADERARARAADELGKMGPPAARAVPALIAAMRDASRKVRASAVIALGDIGAASGEAVPSIIRALDDKNADVRYSAALALSRIPTPAARKAFARYVREEFSRGAETESP
jgi:hypothetical protein